MGRPSVLTNEERVLKKVAHKRFHKLLHVRIARRMVPVLGQEKWAGFVKDVLAFGKPLYVSAFKPGNYGVADQSQEGAVRTIWVQEMAVNADTCTPIIPLI